LFVGWIGTESEPGIRVILVVAENGIERRRSEPADLPCVVVGDERNVCPAVVVSDHLERQGESRVRPG